MEGNKILEFFKGKSILITGSTGFLAKIFVEKLLRVQPDVKKLFLLIRASDASSAMQRLHSEILAKELFSALKNEHGKSFQSFAESKLQPIAGDIVYENLGIQDAGLRQQLWREVEIVVNVAATTNFYERYDVALDINVLGAKHVLEFAKKCARLEMLLHTSTAYVAGTEHTGLILEKKYRMGETLKGGSDSYLDIEAELTLADERKRQLRAHKASEETEKIAMKELGIKRARLFGWPNTYVYTKAMAEMLIGQLKGNLPLVILRPTIILSIFKEPLPGWIEGIRTVDGVLMGYVEAKLSCIFGDANIIADVIPGDMVVNAMIATIAAHAGERGGELPIYHMGSSVRNPVSYATIEECGFRYFLLHPRVGKNGKTIKTNRLRVFRNMTVFRGYMALKYKVPLEILHLVNLLSCRRFGRRYKELNKKYNFGMRLVDLYEPYAFFKGCFDDLNLEKLRMKMQKEGSYSPMFDFDPKQIDWKDYFYNIHIPGVLKYAMK